MADRDWWEKIESLLKGLGVVGIPAVLTVAGYIANGHLADQKDLLERDKLAQEMLTHAIEVVFKKSDEHVFGHDPTQEGRRAYRAHWVETYNAYAKVKISESFMAIVMEQEALPDGKEVITAVNKLRQPNADGDGWAAVGRIFNTFSAHDPDNAHLNFELLSKDAINKDNTVKAGTMVRARWRVNLRENPDSMEQHGPDDKKPNLMAAGECAKVLRSRANIRGQTWARLDVVECPQTQPGPHVAELR